MMNTITICSGALATIVAIFGAIFALSPDHRFLSLWTFGLAVWICVFAACWGIQQSWIESEAHAKNDEKTKSVENSSLPAVDIGANKSFQANSGDTAAQNSPISQSGNQNTAVLGNNNSVGNTTNVTNNITLIAPALSRTENEDAKVLSPDDKPNPPLRFEMPNGAKAIILGDSQSRFSEFPHTVIKQGNEDMLVLDEEKDRLLISAKFFNSEGKIIAQLVKNKLFFNEKAFWRSESDDHSFTVYDDTATPIIRVNFINASVISITGHFFLRDRVELEITNDFILIYGQSRISEMTSIGSAVSFQVGAN